MDTQQIQQNIIVVSNPKSVGLALILAIFFGPLGLFYVSILGGFVMLIFPFLCTYLFTANSFDDNWVLWLSSFYVWCFVDWVICIIWAVVAANKANNNVIKNSSNQLNTIQNIADKNNQPKYIKKEVKEKTQEETDYENELLLLNRFIKAQKQKIFAGGMSDEIRTRIDNLCLSQDHAIKLLNTYLALFHTDLIDDLKSLNTSYNIIKDNVSKFIELNIIEEKFPHNPKS